MTDSKISYNIINNIKPNLNNQKQKENKKK